MDLQDLFYDLIIKTNRIGDIDIENKEKSRAYKTLQIANSHQTISVDTAQKVYDQFLFLKGLEEEKETLKSEISEISSLITPIISQQGNIRDIRITVNNDTFSVWNEPITTNNGFTNKTVMVTRYKMVSSTN